MAGAVTVGATLRAGWPVLVIPSAINMPIFLLLALMHEPGEPLLDAAWTGIVTGERRVVETNVFSRVDYSPGADLIDVHFQLTKWCMWKWRRWLGPSNPRPL